jgi:uncharacterized protein YbjT (DUF2867 family)
MSASKYTKFAVAGGIGGEGPASAGVGNAITRALLKQGASVKVLARGSSVSWHRVRGSKQPGPGQLTPRRSTQTTSNAANGLKEAGALVVPVDYKVHESLVTALEGVDVVVSALAGTGFPLQEHLARAAKEAGVKLFVPS